MGGDEFVVVIPGADCKQAGDLKERIIYATGSAGHRVSVSVGFAVFPADGDTTEQLLTEADSRMYHFKHQHRSDTEQIESGHLREAAHV
jgi:diguanylate cyclase (GGDEF)-like protein